MHLYSSNADVPNLFYGYSFEQVLHEDIQVPETSATLQQEQKATSEQSASLYFWRHNLKKALLWAFIVSSYYYFFNESVIS